MRYLKIYCTILAAAILIMALSGASFAADEKDNIRSLVDSMTTEQKVAQLFIISPEALTNSNEQHTYTDETLARYLRIYPVGGILFYGGNLIYPDQTKSLLRSITEVVSDACGIKPFLAVDEEGGSVARIASKNAFGVRNVGNMRAICTGSDAYNAAAYIGSYLSELGFNLDFAPDSDVYTNPQNEIVRYRSFGADPYFVSDCVLAQLSAFADKGIISCVKHFPGHGATDGDTHNGMAYVNKTWDELRERELVPFISAVNAGVPVVMIGHFTLPYVTGDSIPCSLSYDVITEKLKNELGFNGLVITDDLSMVAISMDYSPAQSVIAAFKAGADLLLMSDDFLPAYTGMINAVNSGEISMNRIDESVYKILSLKMQTSLVDGLNVN